MDSWDLRLSRETEKIVQLKYLADVIIIILIKLLCSGKLHEEMHG